MLIRVAQKLITTEHNNCIDKHQALHIRIDFSSYTLIGKVISTLFSEIKSG